MSVREGTAPGFDARLSKGWLLANKWLLSRRLVQISILLLFLAGPWWGIWLVKGNLNSSLTLDLLPLTDPFIALQSLLAGNWPKTEMLLGAIIVVAVYALIGGRVYCSWVCPINPISDLAHWMRGRLNIKGGAHISPNTRYWLVAAILILSVISGTVVWELVNPVSMLHRGLIFGIGSAWTFVLAVFLFELLIARHGWCGKLCPVGAFYNLLGRRSLLVIRAAKRNECDDCMDCFSVCPEPKVLKPMLKGAASNLSDIAPSPCTHCARCIDVCNRDVFKFDSRYHGSLHKSGFPAGTEV